MTTQSETNPESPQKAISEAQADAAQGVGEKSPENASETKSQSTEKPKEIGGRGGLDPARYGDWEVNGRCYDF